MAPISLPRITVTAPDGDQTSVVLVVFPATSSELSPFWELFSGPAPSPDAPPAGPVDGGHNLSLDVSDYQFFRFDPEEFVENKCRFCGKEFKLIKGLRQHLRGSRGNGPCPPAKKIIRDRQVEELMEKKEQEKMDVDEVEEDDEAPAKKQRKN
ncbi:hypothetical protein NW762_010352 [Fusarium torreyae]|uniref:C2H2-type domain-containing protein n=1 Tax=Fusarium torreyae TaxID=1237075 RepID=A0A9W8RTQ4_9HYPO|nr:hypothetical protein NW762_010352 [Fusarium torreyae]